MTLAATGTDERCPRCRAGLVMADPAPAWCPACEWGLDAFDRHRAPRTWGLRAGDRADHWLAFRLNRRQYDSLVGRTVGRRGNPLARVAMLLLATPLLLLMPLVLAAGVYLAGSASPIGMVLGPAIIICTLVLVWPRRREEPLWQPWVVDEVSAPALFGLLRRVADAAGTPMPHEVHLDHDVNAAVTVRGIRRRRVLCVGLPLWAALDPQERVGLLAHEFGHFVNHDARRGLVVRGGLRVLHGMLGVLAGAVRGGSLWVLPVVFLGAPVLWLLSVTLLILSGRDSQRAEYLADQIATRVAGTAAVAGLFDGLLISDGLPAAVAAGHRSPADPLTWRTAAAHLRTSTPLETLALLSLRTEASLLRSHPPTGLRRRMVRSRPAQAAQIEPDEQEWAAVGRDLAPWFAKLAKRLSG
ncbi:M48 family metallopeptidase [Dactylosporangium sp. NPDC005555]|uniref:M48 family metallopeptidase n=1 Tax=Dactylosporangium sp. NPDC005555 TaxID=3154889 RepID=UPI0033AEFFAC